MFICCSFRVIIASPAGKMIKSRTGSVLSRGLTKRPYKAMQILKFLVMQEKACCGSITHAGPYNVDVDGLLFYGEI